MTPIPGLILTAGGHSAAIRQSISLPAADIAAGLEAVSEAVSVAALEAAAEVAAEDVAEKRHLTSRSSELYKRVEEKFPEFVGPGK